MDKFRYQMTRPLSTLYFQKAVLRRVLKFKQSSHTISEVVPEILDCFSQALVSIQRHFVVTAEFGRALTRLEVVSGSLQKLEVQFHGKTLNESKQKKLQQVIVILYFIIWRVC